MHLVERRRPEERVGLADGPFDLRDRVRLWSRSREDDQHTLFAQRDSPGRLGHEEREEGDHRAERRPSHVRSMRLSPEGSKRLRRFLALRNAGFERGRERFADCLELDPVQDVLEEATHDQPLRLTA
jgi:hypothetical protein